jgi:hypothetical protein
MFITAGLLFTEALRDKLVFRLKSVEGVISKPSALITVPDLTLKPEPGATVSTWACMVLEKIPNMHINSI